MCWDKGVRPRQVLIIKKKDNPEATETLLRMIKWLQEREIAVMVEPAVYDELNLPSVTTWDKGVRILFSTFIQFSFCEISTITHRIDITLLK